MFGFIHIAEVLRNFFILEIYSRSVPPRCMKCVWSYKSSSHHVGALSDSRSLLSAGPTQSQTGTADTGPGQVTRAITDLSPGPPAESRQIASHVHMSVREDKTRRVSPMLAQKTFTCVPIFQSTSRRKLAHLACHCLTTSQKPRLILLEGLG